MSLPLGYIHVKYCVIFKSFLLCNRLSNFQMGPSVERVLKNLFKWFRAIEQVVHHAHIW